MFTGLKIDNNISLKLKDSKEGLSYWGVYVNDHLFSESLIVSIDGSSATEIIAEFDRQTGLILV